MLFLLLQLMLKHLSHDIVLEADKIGSAIQPTMYGIFFEDINFGADGGLYGELIKNRAFQFPQSFMGWNIFGNVSLKDDGHFEKNPHYVRLGHPGHSQKHTGVENKGFFGIGIKSDSEYVFKVWARCKQNPLKITVELIKNDSMEESQSFESKVLTIDSTEWKQHEVILTPTRTESKAHLRVFLQPEQPGDYIDLTHFSLFPTDTFKNRKNGLRKDLAQALADLKPGVLRFPGGCVVEGTDEKTRYQWKNTIGEVENRPLNENRWHYTFTYRFFPDYFQSGGLGFYEYFQLAEDIGAEPLPILNVGLICQYQNDAWQQIELTRVNEFVQDALDLIEFANGDPLKSKFAKIRADMGHEKPFNLKYLGIGNEQWGTLYPERLDQFLKPIRSLYPEISIVGSAGPNPDGIEFDYLWTEMRHQKVDLVDEHYYRNEEWFLANADRYDNYPREGSKVFAGEYACHGNGKKFNHFNAALLEAAFMTGLERNCDVVYMATYAPLFAHVEGWQWRPDLIWFDNLRCVRTCSYYVQKLFSNFKGTNGLQIKLNGRKISGKENQDGLFGSAVWDENNGEYIIKIVNTNDTDLELNVKFDGLPENVYLVNGTRITFHSDDPLAENTLDNPETVIPVEGKLNIDGHVLNVVIGSKSFEIYKFKKENH